MFYFYRVPLYFAIRCGDLGLIKLLLKFDASVNCKVRDVPLLVVAVRSACSAAVKMLVDAGADLSDGVAVRAVLETGDRMTLAVLLENRGDDLIREFDEHSLLWYATRCKSPLVSVIACETRNEMEKRGEIGSDGVVNVYPRGSSRQQKKDIDSAMEYGELLPDLAEVRKIVGRVCVA